MKFEFSSADRNSVTCSVITHCIAGLLKCFTCLQSLKAQMLRTTLRASDSEGLDRAHKCAFLTSSQVTPVTSVLSSQEPQFKNCCHRGMLLPPFFLFLLHKLPGPGPWLKKLWIICVVPGILTPTVRLISSKMRLYRWGWMWL